jgi:hypothetical protein
MPLSTVNLNTQVSWMLTTTNAYGTTTSEGPDSLQWNLGSINVGVWDQLFASAYTLAPGSSTTINLQSLTNLVGESFAFGGILYLQVVSYTGSVTLSPGASNPFPLHFGGTTPTWTVQPGGLFVSGEPTSGGVLVTSSACNIKFANTGAMTCQFDLVIVGDTAETSIFKVVGQGVAIAIS